MSTIVVNKCLSPELTVELVDDILYRNELIWNSKRDRPKRKLIDQQMFVSIILCLVSTQRKTRLIFMSDLR